MIDKKPENALRGDGIKLSDWIPDPDGDYCSMRIIEGSDPEVIATRVAFIEKTPRVRVMPYVEIDGYREVNEAWFAGPKGCDYGADVESRGWCDQQLISLGYDVPNPVPYKDCD